MTLTVDQWNTKIRKWVPSHFFIDQGKERGAITSAFFYAMAAMFQQIEQDMNDQQQATFIELTEAPILDLIGAERNIDRVAGESDAAYALRVQTGLFVSVGLSHLMTVVNSFLNNGSAFFIENLKYGFFDDADTSETAGIPYFDDYNTRWIELTKWYNWWTVIVPAQLAGDQDSMRSSIISGIEGNKAEGTTYDVLYETV